MSLSMALHGPQWEQRQVEVVVSGAWVTWGGRKREGAGRWWRHRPPEAVVSSLQGWARKASPQASQGASCR